MKRRGILPTLAPRQVTVIPSSIPTYASGCTDSFRYSSACSCIGVNPTTITASTPTTTVTVSTTTNFVAAPTVVAAENGFTGDCTDSSNNVLDTIVPFNECVVFQNSASVQITQFIPGACLPSQCTLNFYTPYDCSGPIQGTLSMELDQCINDSTWYSVLLVCPGCPHS